MSEDEKNLKFLTKLRSVLEDDALTRKEFVDAFAQVVKIIKELKSANATELRTMNDFLTRMSEKMKSDVSSEMSSAEKKTMSYCEAEMKKIMKEHEAKMREVDMKMAMVQDGLDGKDADELRIVQDVLTKLPPPPFIEPFAIRDKLEGIGEEEQKLAISSIAHLEEKLKDLEKRAAARTGSIGGFNYNSMDFHIIDDETPTGTVNGVNTTFTIKDVPNPVSSLKVYVNGQRMRVTTDYTFAGVTITFVTAPPTSSTILVDYRK
ncbi:MAG: hypothetical protein AAB922_05750 [Patescibacteria group bacterium]